ncbi:ComEA family DNA-binding protein [Leptolyngbya sp. PCC 6406]|uniref:ComEA family DNA-binding protein n=1 Tax=Leptolyngbya sp. PCC 6406 TaxID=1173264 RepID=UPI0002AC4D21|nr:helix-hairpin-helix domain-containing protein [Leptolyngbya sp. PCC 6406]
MPRSPLQHFHPLRQRLRQNPQTRLRSRGEVEIAAAMGLGIDANRATIDDWLRLPGISIHQARTLTELTRSGVIFFALEDVAAALGLPVAALDPLAPGIQFRYYDTDSLVPTPIDLNQATVEQLCRVPELPRDWAEWIVRSRLAGPYRSLEDFQHRCQVPPAAMSRWLHHLRI